jgi:cytochrome c peroxidase
MRRILICSIPAGFTRNKETFMKDKLLNQSGLKQWSLMPATLQSNTRRSSPGRLGFSICSGIGMAAIFLLTASAAHAGNGELEPIEQLGKHLMFDQSLSTPPKMSCATCHAPEAGFTSPDAELNEDFGIYHGAIEVRFGNRKIPSAAYAGDSPPLYYDEDLDLWIGGMFWDGRATGWVLGDPLAEQAMGPFLNPVEHNVPFARQVVRKVALSGYAELFRQVWGPGSLDPVKDVEGSYERIARSIAAYERSHEVNPFDSKYDYWLNGEVQLTPEEELGRQLFDGKANCAICHNSQPGPNGEPPLFTGYSYANLGLPKNPHNPFYTQPRKFGVNRANWIDPGLGGFLMSLGLPAEVYQPEIGKHKTPTLRNVDRRPSPDFVKAYGHNGVFKSLEEVVHFYNTRAVPGMGWPDPEVPVNITGLLGDLGLTPLEESALVAFLKTLTDGYVPSDD